MSTTTRTAILSRLRSSLGVREDDSERQDAVDDRLALHARNTIPGRAKSDPSTLRQLFVSMLEESKASVSEVASADVIPEAVSDYLKQHNLPQRLRMGTDPLLGAADWSKVPHVERDIGAAEETDQVGLAAAFAGIAETGTLMLTSGQENPTTNNFLPENHIVVVPASRLAGSYEDAWTALRDAIGSTPMPRTVNYVSGPSRTGDIEQTLLLGAHGPRRLHVIIVNSA